MGHRLRCACIAGGRAPSQPGSRADRAERRGAEGRYKTLRTPHGSQPGDGL